VVSNSGSDLNKLCREQSGHIKIITSAVFGKWKNYPTLGNEKETNKLRSFTGLIPKAFRLLDIIGNMLFICAS